MASIFDLKTNPSELSSANQGTSRMQYEQEAPTRDVTTTNFANGPIHFKWEQSGQKWFLPNRVALRTRLEITDAAGLPIILADDVAANMGLMANLFQSMEFRIADKTVSRISDFCPQVDALETRASKSAAWLESVGSSLNFWQEDFKERQADVAIDGLYSKSKTAPDFPVAISRVGLGADAAGGAGNDRNAFSYNAATSVVTLAENGGAAIAGLDVGIMFPVGSYVQWPTIQGAAANDQRLNTRVQVLQRLTATTFRVQLGVILTDIAVDGRTDINSLRGDALSVNDARRAGKVEVIWTPPLSIFKVGHAMPAGKYELILTPQTVNVYPIRAIQSQLAAKVPFPMAAADFRINVVSMYLYRATVEGPRADNITYLLDLEQTRCQAEKIDNTSFGQKAFDVSPSTYALTVAYQDLRAGQDSRVSASLFRSYEDLLVAGTIPTPYELRLNRMYVNYAGQNMPSPDADPTFIAGTDYTAQRYAETIMNSGGYYSAGGVEDIQEFHKRGAYYYFSWPKDGTDRSTRVTVHQQFSDLTPVVNMRVLLFDHSKQVCRVRVQDGRVVDVQLEDA